MSNKIFVGVVLAVLIIGGYVVYNNYIDDKTTEVTDNGVSFMCEDGSGFIAVFATDMAQVEILVDGRSEHILQNAGDELVPYRFGSGTKIYTFVGEEVVVADLGANTSIVCHQPFDQNNAPYNFGDSGEGAGSQDEATAVSENILGSWQSSDDAKFVREFKADGIIVDHYEGDADTIGAWSAFTAADKIDTPFPQDPEAVYLRVVMNDFPEEVLYFELAKLTPEELELFFLGAGGVLSFKKVENNRQ